ncbi:interferon alpha/beta receptor 2-like [Eucyclogobius newberryi]|uniref:interferon alpha/beta receptor 2-like n=1 Tax=Eucyclogobius newberryi TaxID=166745 RepID=UPI003B59A3C9
MKLLLLACLTRLCTAVALPAPRNLYMSSLNFRHVLHWTAAPDSPPGLNYHVYSRSRVNSLAESTKTWAAVRLPKHEDVYRLYVKSCINTTCSPASSTISFMPFMQTNISAPNVTISGCGTCIQMNISLPETHRNSRIQDIYKNLSFHLFLRRPGQETVVITEPAAQTLVIPNLMPGTEYCVQLKPQYLEVNFQPSSWKCVFTSPAPPSAFAAVVSVSVVVVVLLLAGLLVLLALQYTGIICKLKEAMPHTLIASLRNHSLLSLERTCPELVSLPPRPERPQHSPWDQEEEEEEDQEEDQEEDPYMDRGADMSSDSSLRCGHVTTSSQSAATVPELSAYPRAGFDEHEEKEQTVKADDRMKRGLLEGKEEEEWHKELQKDESVNLFSVTIAALDVPCEEGPSDDLPCLNMPCHTLLPQQTQDTDDELTDLLADRSYYMHHQI